MTTASPTAELRAFIAKFSPGDQRLIRACRATAKRLADPEVEALIAQAITQSKAPFLKERGGKLVIRSVSAKQRPRRKTA